MFAILEQQKINQSLLEKNHSRFIFMTLAQLNTVQCNAMLMVTALLITSAAGVLSSNFYINHMSRNSGNLDSNLKKYCYAIYEWLALLVVTLTAPNE